MEETKIAKGTSTTTPATMPTTGAAATAQILTGVTATTPKDTTHYIADVSIAAALEFAKKIAESQNAERNVERHKDLANVFRTHLLGDVNFKQFKANLNSVLKFLKDRNGDDDGGRSFKLFFRGHGLDRWSHSKEKEKYKLLVTLLATIAWDPANVKDIKTVSEFGANMKRYIDENIVA